MSCATGIKTHPFHVSLLTVTLMTWLPMALLIAPSHMPDFAIASEPIVSGTWAPNASSVAPITDAGAVLAFAMLCARKRHTSLSKAT